jgi:hypothetical protein
VLGAEGLMRIPQVRRMSGAGVRQPSASANRELGRGGRTAGGRSYEASVSPTTMLGRRKERPLP